MLWCSWKCWFWLLIFSCLHYVEFGLLKSEYVVNRSHVNKMLSFERWHVFCGSSLAYHIARLAVDLFPTYPYFGRENATYCRWVHNLYFEYSYKSRACFILMILLGRDIFQRNRFCDLVAQVFLRDQRISKILKVRDRKTFF